MKALSLIQPWAWLVTAGPKRIENRTWHLPASMQGARVLIHASKTDPRRYGDAGAFLRERGLTVRMPVYPERGGLVGWATLVGCLCPGVHPATEPHAEGVDLRWWMQEQHGWLLGDVGVVPFVPCRGAMGFFLPPADVLAQLPDEVRT